MKARHKRLLAILFSLLGISIATIMILKAFDKNLLYYTTPSELVAELLANETAIEPVTIVQAKKYHLGGMVKENSVVREANSLLVDFVLTDYTSEIPVSFSGILPDLFKEGQGIIAIGKIQKDGTLLADKVLAKHDENYMPPNLPAKNSPESGIVKSSDSVYGDKPIKE